MNTVEKKPSLLNEMRRRKAEDIKHRGLMSYPVDEPYEKPAQEMAKFLLECLPGFKEFESPTTGLKLAVDKDFCPQMFHYFLVGDYEENDMQLIKKHVTPGSRVLELGAGVGLTGSMLAKVSGNPVTLVEPNTLLHGYIEKTFAANQVDYKLINAAVVADHVELEMVPFFRSKKYWWSSLYEGNAGEELVVPAIRLSDAIQQAEADTLLVDIEGYEGTLLSDLDSIKGINTLLVEVHTPAIGTEASAGLFNSLIKGGFSMVDFSAHTFVFKRPAITQLRGEGRWY